MRARAFVLLLAVLAATSCKTFEEVESGNPSPERMGEQGSASSQGRMEEDFSNPAAQEGEFDLDSELCWQSIGSAPQAAGDDSAYIECMREKGWTHTP